MFFAFADLQERMLQHISQMEGRKGGIFHVPIFEMKGTTFGTLGINSKTSGG
jgi:hypothetical protein